MYPSLLGSVHCFKFNKFGLSQGNLNGFEVQDIKVVVPLKKQKSISSILNFRLKILIIK